MSDLISRSALLEKLEEHIEYKEFDYYQEEPLINMSFEQLEDIICSQPTVEAKPVVHGEWIDNTGYLDSVKQYKCSVCGEKPVINVNYRAMLTNFCPNCGADMRKKVQE